MTAILSPSLIFQGVGFGGFPLPGGKLFSYIAGTSTPQATYTDSTQGTPNANPVILNSNGQAAVWLDPTKVYKFILQDFLGNQVYVTDQVQGFLTAAALTQQIIGAVLYPRTSAEISASITPTNFWYGPFLDVNRYGLIADNATDDTAAWNSAIAVANAIGGSVIFGLRGRTSKTTATLTPLTNVRIDLEKGVINANLTGTGGLDYGAMKLRSNSEICNGTVNVISSGSVGSQAGIHAAINVGPLYGDGGTSVAVSPDEGVFSWAIRNMTLSTSRAGKVCIQVMGGANNGVISNITCPDSATVAGVVHLDWGFVGTIVSSAASMAANKANFLAGNAWTTHPNAISITNIKGGNLTYNAANVGDCIRMSGVHGISVDVVEVDGTTNAGFYHTASDVGYEFAPTAIKPYAHRGITVKNFNVKNANNGWGFFHDTFADNVALAQNTLGYVPIIDPIAETDFTLERCFTSSGGGASVIPGYRFQNTRGGSMIDCEATGHLWGAIIDNAGHRCRIIRGRFWKNRNDGISVGKSVTTAPQDVLLEDVFCDQNGQDAGYSPNAGIYIQQSVRCKVMRGKTGADGYVTEATQQRGIWVVDTTATFVSIRDHYVNAVKTGGIAYVVSGTTDYGILDVFSGNRSDPAVSNFYAGANIIPDSVEFGADGVTRRKWRTLRVNLTAGTTPTAGAWLLGDIIFYSDPIASDFVGTTCITAGSPGTWKRFGATTA